MEKKMKTFLISGLVMIVFSAIPCLPSAKPAATKYTFLPAEKLPQQNNLSDPFLRPDSTRVSSKAEWEAQRQYLKDMLTFYQYGEMPLKPDYHVEDIYTTKILKSALIEKKMFMVLNRNGQSVKIRFGVRRPNKDGKFPVIIKNDTFVFDLDDIKDQEKRQHYRQAGRDNTEDFVAQEAVKRDYVICKFIRDDVAADTKDSHETGIYTLYPDLKCGTITAWAWFYQLLIDYLQDQDYVDGQKIVATGHSRGGKTALCAGIYENRITITAPNSSGTGGTGSWKFFDKDRKPQLIKYHTKSNPHWWADPVYDFTNREARLPFDAHINKILIAPRAIVNPHARQDYWANPYGTYLTYLAAQKVFDWLGVPEHNAIHWREGTHNQNQEDWSALFDYCDYIFFNKPTNRIYNAPHDVNFKGNPKYSGWPALIPWEAPKDSGQ